MKKILLPLIAIIPLLTSGCASIMSGTTDLVKVSSDPDEAKVTISNKAGEVINKTQTPVTLNLKKSRGYFKGETYTVKLEKKGYQTQSFTVDSQPNGWYLAGNLVFGGLIGWFAVDPVTGAMFSLTPDEINVKLVPEEK